MRAAGGLLYLGFLLGRHHIPRRRLKHTYRLNHHPPLLSHSYLFDKVYGERAEPIILLRSLPPLLR